MINFFLLGCIITLFCKEYVVVNDDLIIYTTFVSLTLLAITSFSMLPQVFADLRSAEQESLKITSIKVMEDMKKSDLQAALVEHTPVSTGVLLDKSPNI